jgi:hypothetical protein
VKSKTVGEASLEAKENSSGPIEARELQQAVHEGNTSDDSWESQLFECAERGKKLYKGDFYLTVLMKKERLLSNVVRQMFLPRQSCPTPEWDQTVFRFRRGSDDIEFLWTIPDKETCAYMITNKTVLPLEEMELLKFIEDFASGKLDTLSRKLNRELA